MTNLPTNFAEYATAFSSAQGNQHLIVVSRMKEALKTCLAGKDTWAASYYQELLMDTLFEGSTAERRMSPGRSAVSSIPELRANGYRPMVGFERAGTR